MKRRFDVFVSYAGEDREFACVLVEWLEQAGLNVWYAEEDMRGGEEIQTQIAATVPCCRHAVFVISADWLRKDWTLWERDLVLEDCPEDRRVLCLMRVPRKVGELGPKLHRLKSIDWRPEAPEPDACFWQLLCGLGLFELGKKRDWAESGRAARGATGSNIVASTPAEAEARGALQASRGGAHQALTVDRDPQWGELSRYATDPRHEAILVAGPRGQGHKYFLERIVACLPRDPSRRICEVVWSGACPPQARGTALAAIAQALDCAPERLETTLRGILSEQNLVLVHQPPFEETECDALVRYYTEWLPELIRAVDPPDAPHPGKLKLVQAVRWPEVSTIKCGLSHAARLFKKDGLGRLCAKVEAAKALRKQLERASGPLPVMFLEELGPITREQVASWSRSLDLDDASREKLIADALDGAEHSVDILNRITERLDPQRRSA